MAFLAPFMLAFAALAGVPLLVHLLRRRVGRTYDFPAVRYLARMEQEHSRERKLRHRLLLLLRILAVIALALAAARPIARLAGLGHAPVSIAVVIDNSMSSGAAPDGRVVLDDMRAAARALLDDLTPDDRAWLVTADGRVIGGSLAALNDALTALKPLGGRGDLLTATRRGITLSRSGAPRSPVVAVVSDGQAAAWQELSLTAGASEAGGPAAAGPAAAADGSADQRSTGDPLTTRTVDAGDVPVRVLNVPARSVRNVGIVEARAEPARWTPTGSVSFAMIAADSAAWRVALDGRTVARGTAAAGSATSPSRVTQKLATAANGWVRGSVEVDADELRGDDVRWFAVRVAPPPTVATRAESGPFLTAALATLVDEKRLDRGAEGSRGVVTITGADATIAKGPVFLTAPADPVRIGEANRTLARLGIPWRFGAIARDLVLARGNTSLDGAQVRVRYPLQRSTAGAASLTADTLATAGGAPWIVSGAGYVLVGSPIEPDATDLPLRAGFVPWLLDALSRRLGDDGRILAAVPGAQITDHDLSSATALERPDGSLVPLSGSRLTVPNESGVYFLRRQATRIGAVVVNAEAQESDLRADAPGATGAAFRSRVSGAAVAVDSVPADWRRDALDQAAGRSLLAPLVALALMALLLEAWFSRGTLAPGTATARNASSAQAQSSAPSARIA